MTFATWYHASVQPVKRSAGRSSVAAAAYRIGERLHDERMDIVHDYRARSGVVSSFTIAPAGAPEWATDPERLWNAAEAKERVNGVVARELRLALPASCSPEARQSIVEDMSAELVSRYGVAVSAAIHLPDKDGSDRNHHAHILFTTREMTEHGLGAKTRVLDDFKTTGPEEIRHIRVFAANLVNDALADAGSDERVTPESYATLGINQEPTVHLGPFATDLERQGLRSDLGDINRQIARDNARMDQLVDELAELDASIAEQMAQRYESGDSLLIEDRTSEPSADIMTSEESEEPFVMVHEGNVELAQPERVSSDRRALEPDTSANFEGVHQETVAEATAEREAMTQDRRSRWASAVERVSAWWQNMREHFVEWRGYLQERVDGFFSQPEPVAPTPNSDDPDANGMEPQV